MDKMGEYVEVPLHGSIPSTQIIPLYGYLRVVVPSSPQYTPTGLFLMQFRLVGQLDGITLPFILLANNHFTEAKDQEMT
jgi:hypothetical protein